MSVYALKSRFQGLLRPFVNFLAGVGVTANQVTLLAAFVSVVLGGWLIYTGPSIWFLLIPVWFFLRMALNAIDGMLAREHHQKSRLGGYLNELCDVVSDAALYLPFAYVYPLNLPIIGTIIFLSILSEYAGVLGPMMQGERRYDGPMGKSDRAVVFGVLGLWTAFSPELPSWLVWVLAIVGLLIVLTIFNRIRAVVRS